jgi:hypothetical protein
MDNNVPVDDIIRYEEGEMSDEDMIAMFQKLVNSGLAWQLQGSYGRTARDLIEAGYITA